MVLSACECQWAGLCESAELTLTLTILQSTCPSDAALICVETGALETCSSRVLESSHPPACDSLAMAAGLPASPLPETQSKVIQTEGGWLGLVCKRWAAGHEGDTFVLRDILFPGPLRGQKQTARNDVSQMLAAHNSSGIRGLFAVLESLEQSSPTSDCPELTGPVKLSGWQLEVEEYFGQGPNYGYIRRARAVCFCSSYDPDAPRVVAQGPWTNGRSKARHELALMRQCFRIGGAVALLDGVQVLQTRSSPIVHPLIPSSATSSGSISSLSAVSPEEDHPAPKRGPVIDLTVEEVRERRQKKSRSS